MSVDPGALVEPAPWLPAPEGYLAYIVRVWGSAMCGKASAIVSDEDDPNGIRVVLEGDESLGDDAPAIEGRPSVIYLPAACLLTEAVLSLRSRPLPR